MGRLARCLFCFSSLSPPPANSPWSTTSTTLCVNRGPKSGRRATSRHPRSGAARACAHRPPAAARTGCSAGAAGRACACGAADELASSAGVREASATSWATRPARKARQSGMSVEEARAGRGLSRREMGESRSQKKNGEAPLRNGRGPGLGVARPRPHAHWTGRMSDYHSRAGAGGIGDRKAPKSRGGAVQGPQSTATVNGGGGAPLSPSPCSPGLSPPAAADPTPPLTTCGTPGWPGRAGGPGRPGGRAPPWGRTGGRKAFGWGAFLFWLRLLFCSLARSHSHSPRLPFPLPAPAT